MLIYVVILFQISVVSYCTFSEVFFVDLYFWAVQISVPSNKIIDSNMLGRLQTPSKLFQNFNVRYMYIVAELVNCN